MRYAQGEYIDRRVARYECTLIPYANVKPNDTGLFKKIPKSNTRCWAGHFLIKLIAVGFIKQVSIDVSFLNIRRPERIAQQRFYIETMIWSVSKCR